MTLYAFVLLLAAVAAGCLLGFGFGINTGAKDQMTLARAKTLSVATFLAGFVLLVLLVAASLYASFWRTA